MKKSRVVKRIICTVLALAMCLGEMPEISVYAANSTLHSTIYDASQVDLSLYTNRTQLQSALQRVINGDIPLKPGETKENSDAEKKNYALGSIAFSRDKGDVLFYFKNGDYSGTECYAYAKGVYEALFGDVMAGANYNKDTSQKTDKLVGYDQIKANVRNEPGAYIRLNGKGKEDSYDHSCILLKYDDSGMAVLNANMSNTGRKVCIQFFRWSDINYFHYAIQPKQEHYDELYPACDHEWAGGVCKKCYAIDYNVIEETTLPSNKVVKVNVNNAYVNKVPVDIGDTKKVPKNQVLHVKSKIKNGYGNYWYKVSYLDSVW